MLAGLTATRASVAVMQSVPIAQETPNQEVTDQDVATAEEVVPDELIEDELLIEEISIDGMCGVY